MAISNFSRVNQKLSFVRVLLRLATEDDSESRLHQDALLTSALMQFGMAFHFYIREVADRAHVKTAHLLNNFDELESALLQNQQYSAEVAEIKNLLEQPHSWLGQLRLCLDESKQSPAKPKEKKAFRPDENLIEIVEISTAENESPLVLSSAILRAWLANFDELIQRHRETGAEC